MATLTWAGTAPRSYILPASPPDSTDSAPWQQVVRVCDLTLNPSDTGTITTDLGAPITSVLAGPGPSYTGNASPTPATMQMALVRHALVADVNPIATLPSGGIGATVLPASPVYIAEAGRSGVVLFTGGPYGSGGSVSLRITVAPGGPVVFAKTIAPNRQSLLAATVDGRPTFFSAASATVPWVARQVTTVPLGGVGENPYPARYFRIADGSGALSGASEGTGDSLPVPDLTYDFTRPAGSQWEYDAVLGAIPTYFAPASVLQGVTLTLEGAPPDSAWDGLPTINDPAYGPLRVYKELLWLQAGACDGATYIPVLVQAVKLFGPPPPPPTDTVVVVNATAPYTNSLARLLEDQREEQVVATTPVALSAYTPAYALVRRSTAPALPGPACPYRFVARQNAFDGVLPAYGPSYPATYAVRSGDYGATLAPLTVVRDSAAPPDELVNVAGPTWGVFAPSVDAALQDGRILCVSGSTDLYQQTTDQTTGAVTIRGYDPTRCPCAKVLTPSGATGYRESAWRRIAFVDAVTGEDATQDSAATPFQPYGAFVRLLARPDGVLLGFWGARDGRYWAGTCDHVTADGKATFRVQPTPLRFALEGDPFLEAAHPGAVVYFTFSPCIDRQGRLVVLAGRMGMLAASGSRYVDLASNTWALRAATPAPGGGYTWGQEALAPFTAPMTSVSATVVPRDITVRRDGALLIYTTEAVAPRRFVVVTGLTMDGKASWRIV